MKICSLVKGCGGDPVWVSGGVGEVVVYGLNLSIGDFGAIAFGEELEGLNGSNSNSIVTGAMTIEYASLKYQYC